MPTTAPPQPLTEQERYAIEIAEAAYSSLPPSRTSPAATEPPPPPPAEPPVAPPVAPIAKAPVLPALTVAQQVKKTLLTGRDLVTGQVHKYLEDRALERSGSFDIPGFPTLPLVIIQRLIAAPAKKVTEDLLNSVEELHQAHDGADLKHLDHRLIEQIGLGFATQSDSEAALALVPEVEKMTGTRLHKKWLSTMDGRTRPLHAQLHTNSVPVGEPFYSGPGGTIRYPGDPLAPLEQTINCRCHLIFTPADAEEAEEEVPLAAYGGVLVAARRVGRVVDRLFDLLHPRGRDGRFIEKNAIVDVFGLHGFQHGQRGNKSVRGKVVDIFPDPNDSDESIIRVQMEDPRWDVKQFGPTMDVRKDQVAQHVKPKGNLPTTTPTATTPKPPQPTVPKSVPLPMAPTPNLTVDPKGPNFKMLERPPEWESMDNDERLDWVSETMTADLTEFRGEGTDWRMEAGSGFDAEIAFNMANRYRQLTNWDPETAKRIDAITGTKSQKEYHSSYSVGGATAVAHPGTEHPGGIGPIDRPAIITLRQSLFNDPSYWLSHKTQIMDSGLPWTTNGDPTVVLAHEFSHQRQFRYFEEVGAVAKGQVSPVSNRAWSPLARMDGFDRVADSSNWDTTQQLRYDIQHNAPTEYGRSKSSEAYAESWAARLRGESDPIQDKRLDDWEARMGVPDATPKPLIEDADQIPWEQATPEQIDEFWTKAGPLFLLPEVKERYPQATKEYNAWLASKPGVPTETVKVRNIDDVNAYLAEHPQEPGEDYFAWQSRICDDLDPDQKNALLFQTRERYEPVDYIVEGVTRWRKEHGLPEPQVDISEIPIPREKADTVARYFETTPDQSSDPHVQAVYEEFKKQTEEMWGYMTKPESEGGLGITVGFTDEKNPYPTAAAQADDLRNNHHITLESGLGNEHDPTMTRDEYDRFRAVHDVFGHAAVGGGFDRHGEYQAYLLHSSMYTGDGRVGMATEYHGVNTANWGGDPGTPGTGKSILLPEELIPLPWSPDGVLVMAAASPEIPQGLQLTRLNITDNEAEAIAYLAVQADIDAEFVRQYEPMMLHPAPAPEDEMETSS